MAFWNVRVCEVSGEIAAHREALHDAPGTHVDRRREGDDFPEIQLAEGVAEGRPRPSGGVPLAPLVGGKPPADLYRGGEPGRKCSRPEADVSDEASGVFTLHGPEAVAELSPALADQLDESTGALLGVRLRKVLHDHGVGVDRREFVHVSVAPSP